MSSNNKSKNIPSYLGFQVGSWAARKGRLCQIKKIDWSVSPPSVVVLMMDNDCEVGTEFDRLSHISSFTCSMCTAINTDIYATKCCFCGMNRNYAQEQVTLCTNTNNGVVENPQQQQQQQQQQPISESEDVEATASDAEEVGIDQASVVAQNINHKKEEQPQEEEEQEEEPKQEIDEYNEENSDSSCSSETEESMNTSQDIESQDNYSSCYPQQKQQQRQRQRQQPQPQRQQYRRPVYDFFGRPVYYSSPSQQQQQQQARRRQQPKPQRRHRRSPFDSSSSSFWPSQNRGFFGGWDW